MLLPRRFIQVTSYLKCNKKLNPRTLNINAHLKSERWYCEVIELYLKSAHWYSEVPGLWYQINHILIMPKRKSIPACRVEHWMAITNKKTIYQMPTDRLRDLDNHKINFSPYSEIPTTTTSYIHLPSIKGQENCHAFHILSITRSCSSPESLLSLPDVCSH